MPNSYYNRVFDVLPASRIASQAIEDEFSRIEVGFDNVTASTALTGTPTAPTAATPTNTTQIATTAFAHNLMDANLSTMAADVAATAADRVQTGLDRVQTGLDRTAAAASAAAAAASEAVLAGPIATIDINGGTIDGTVIGGASKAAGGFTDLTVTGNTTLGDAVGDTVTINANRILGDFNNATVDYRTLLKAKSAGVTNISIVPNGPIATGSGATQVNLYDENYAGNGSFFALINVKDTEARLVSNRVGTGNYLPIAFYTGATEAFRINSGLNGTVNNTVTGLKVTELNGGPLAGFRNRIINGGFDVWQRGTSISAPTNAYTADRWMAYVGEGSGTNVTYSRVSLSASLAATYGMQISTSSSTNKIGLLQPLESFEARKLAGQTVTLSFWAYTSSGTVSVNLSCMRNSSANTATGGTWVTVSTATTCAVTTTPQRFSWTGLIPIDGTAEGVCAYINADNVANGSTFYVYNVQLEIGSTATPFEARPIGTEKQLCGRYARSQSIWVGTSSAQTCFPLDMRSTPTITGGGAGFTSTNTTADTLICYQTTAAAQTLLLVSEL